MAKKKKKKSKPKKDPLMKMLAEFSKEYQAEKMKSLSHMFKKK